jgi:hypothetical protein
LLIQEGILDALRKTPGWDPRYEQETLVLIGLLNHKGINRTDDGWVPVRSEEGRAAFGKRNWSKILKWLMRHGFVERKPDRYVIGAKAYRYRLGAKWRMAPRRKFVTDHPKALRAWYRIRAKDPFDPFKDLTPVVLGLYRWASEVTLDWATAEAFVAAEQDPEKRFYGQLILDVFAIGEKDGPEVIGRRCLYGRYHSIFTRMPRGLRAALRINGRSLGEIDVRSTQPLIQTIEALKHRIATLAAAGLDDTPAGPDQIPPVRKSYYSGPGSDKCRDLFRRLGIMGMSIPHDIIEFFDVYETRDYYRWFASKVGMPCSTDEEREEVKRAWAWLVYGDATEDVALWNHRWDRFKASCPTIAKWLSDMKGGDGAKPYAEPARECQRIESSIVIDTACAYLLEHHPHIPVITIHDAILTFPEYLPIVERVLGDAWLQVVGYVPKFKEKRYEEAA